MKHLDPLSTEKHSYYLLNPPENASIFQFSEPNWLAGSVSDYNTTSWLHLASWNLPDPQLSRESKMEMSVHQQLLQKRALI